MLYVLGGAAVLFTVASYILTAIGHGNKQLPLFAAMMWGVLGGYCFSQSTATWDIYYVLGFIGFIAMIGEGVQAWGMFNKKEEVEDDKELNFEGQLLEARKMRSERYNERKANSKARSEQRQEERAAKRFGI